MSFYLIIRLLSEADKEISNKCCDTFFYWRVQKDSGEACETGMLNKHDTWIIVKMQFDFLLPSHQILFSGGDPTVPLDLNSGKSITFLFSLSLN